MKHYKELNVLDAARLRVQYLYDNFEHEEIWLSFSGGKDSTVCFYLLVEAAINNGAKKINVLIIDLEAHYKDHVKFISDIIQNSPVDVFGYWVCLPFNLSNASSFYEPKWLCWENGKEWVRPMPESKLLVNEENNLFVNYWRKGMEFEEFIIEFPKFLCEQLGLKKVAQIIGIRTQESYNRYLKIAVAKNREFFNGQSWMLKQKSTGKESFSAHPIYDWQTEDVWKYLSGKMYNPVYDKMYLAGIPISEMRICQPYGEEQRDNIELFSKIEPDTWARVVERVSGANFAKIYKGLNVLKGRIQPPENTTWEQWGRLILNTMPPYLKEHYLRNINVFLRWWRMNAVGDIKTVYGREYGENEGFDADGVYIYQIPDSHDLDKKKAAPSWRRITKCLVKGDYHCKALTFSANQKEYEKLEQLKQKYNDHL
jgi:predicted phosphoadenosine phosphosulfate sulfurtransferase